LSKKDDGNASPVRGLARCRKRGSLKGAQSQKEKKKAQDVKKERTTIRGARATEKTHPITKGNR